MTDKVQKIREEVARLYNQSLADEKRQADRGLERAANVSYGKSKACKEILSFIDTPQEEPVSEEWIEELRTKLDSLSKEDFKKVFDKYAVDFNEEPVSEDFEATLAKEWQGYVDRGAATVDALEDNTQELAFAKGFYRGWNYPKSSVWHDANKEQPEIGSAVAVWNPKIMDGEILTMCAEVYQDRIWAYIDDLLKL